MNQTVYAVTHDLPAVPLGGVKLTAGKLYPIAYECANSFDIIDDAGAQVPCFWRDCAFGGSWARAVMFEDQQSVAKDDAFTHGYLIAVSSLIGGYGATDLAEYLLQELGAVPEETIQRLDLCEYDLENLAPVLQAVRDLTEVAALLNPEPTPAGEVVL